MVDIKTIVVLATVKESDLLRWGDKSAPKRDDCEH